MDRKIAWTAAFALTLGCGSAWAEDHEGETDDGAAFGATVSGEAQAGGADGEYVAERARALGGAEATIELMDDADAESSEAVTQDLPDLEELPEEAAFGQGVAADARDGGVNGADVAAEAMDLAGELAGDALENVEIPGRSDGIPDLPDEAPDVPEVSPVP